MVHATPDTPESVTEGLQRLLEAAVGLEKGIALRERVGSSSDPKARAADRALDDAWGAFQSWLLGWTNLPDMAHPLVADARALYKALFPKGLQFLTLAFKDEHGESKRRLEYLVEGRLDAIVKGLGGEAFLTLLDECHRSYGEVLQITARRDGAVPEPELTVRRALDATHLALREYVAQVAATVRRTHNESIELAAVLLLPLSVRA